MPPPEDPKPRPQRTKRILAAAQQVHSTEQTEEEEDAVMSEDFENLSAQLTKGVTPEKAYMH
ncbi:hypothetical protein BG006_003045, partial [Podila minutissima]